MRGQSSDIVAAPAEAAGGVEAYWRAGEGHTAACGAAIEASWAVLAGVLAGLVVSGTVLLGAGFEACMRCA